MKCRHEGGGVLLVTNLELDEDVMKAEGCVVTDAAVMRVMEELIGLAQEVRRLASSN